MLAERVKEYADEQGRTTTSIVEQALAEFLAVPISVVGTPAGPLELCYICERGVLFHGRCPHCTWKRV